MAPHRPCLLVITAALLLSIAGTSAQAAGRDPYDLPVVRYQLPSGMTVLLHKDTSLPQVVVSLWFDVGSGRERKGRTGFAHLYEHLMFMGSKHVPGGGFDQLMEEAGGSNNAQTSPDTTFYYDSGPSSLLPVLLWLEAERLTTLPQAMSKEKVDLQREVVKNERRQSYENRPYGAAELRIPAALYEKSHPYSWPVIGSHEDLAAARVEDVKQFFYDFYTPSNATLLIAGDFNPEETRRLITHYFGWMPKRPRPPAPTVATAPTRPVEAQVTLSDQVDLARVYLVWHAPPAAAPEAVDAELLADLLGRGEGSRLHRALVYDKHLALEVKVELERQTLGSMLIAEITAQKGVRAEDLLRAAEIELGRVAKEPARPEELERARNQRLTEWAKELEPLVERSHMLQRMFALHGDARALSQEVARLRAVTPEALRAQAMAMGLGDPARRLTLRVLPAPKTAAAAQTGSAAGKAVDKGAVAEDKASAGQAGDKVAAGDKGAATPGTADPRDMKAPFDFSKRPSPQSARPFVTPKAARFQVGQLEVLLVQRRGALLQALLVVPAGGAAGTGLAQATAALVSEGAGERTATAVAEALSRRGARLFRHVTQDSTLLGLELTGGEWPQVAPILYDIAARPRLEDKEWQRVRGERIAEVLREQAEASYLADLGAAQGIFGATHPYGQPPLGTEAALQALTLKDLRAFHAKHYRPGAAVLILAGDVELTQAAANALAAPFATWQAPAGAAKKEPEKVLPPPRPEQRRLVLMDRPGAPQSELRLVNLAPPQGSPERPAAEVANMLLGGSFTSRLNQNLRERNGWAYGAASRLSPLSQAGLFVVHAAVRSDATAEATVAALGEERRLLAEPISPRELDKGRRSFTQQLLQLCERVEHLAMLFSEVARYRQPVDAIAQLARGAARVDGAALLRAARGAIKPDAATVVIVGDRKKIEGPLRKKLPGWEVELR